MTHFGAYSAPLERKRKRNVVMPTLSELREQRQRLSDEAREIAMDISALEKILIPVWSFEKSIRQEIEETYDHRTVEREIMLESRNIARINVSLPIAMTGDKARRKELFAVLDNSGYTYREEKNQWRDLSDLHKKFVREIKSLDRQIEKESKKKRKGKGEQPSLL
jgi:hypothetical protein